MFISYIPEDIAIERIHIVKQGRHNRQLYFISNRRTSGLIYVLSGRSVYTVGDRQFTASANDVFYLAQDECYRIDVDSKETFSYIFVNFTLDESCCGAFCSDICMSGCREQLLELFEKLENIYLAKESAYLFSCRIVLCHILAVLINDARRKYLPSKRSTLLLDAVKQMEERYSDPALTIGSLAASVELSEGYFRRLFHEYYLVSPSQYLNALRLSHAKDLLMATDRRISDIASSCGYSSAYYFSAAFRTAAGVSPKAWRASHRENGE